MPRKRKKASRARRPKTIRSRGYMVRDEFDIIDKILEILQVRNSWRCWACNRLPSATRVTHWAVRPRIRSIEIVFWDTTACKELLQRKRVL